MTLELKVSDFLICKVVKICLGMRGYKRKKFHFLSEQVEEKRLLISEGELGRHATCGLVNILLSDEKIFTIHEFSNSQNDRITSLKTYSNKEMLRYVPRLQKPLSVISDLEYPLVDGHIGFLSPMGLKSTLPLTMG